MVMLEAGLKSPRRGTVERLFALLLRLLAIVALIAGMLYWARLIGIAGDGAFRFDLLALHVRILYTTQAVIMPAAALGLWLTARWGVVLWVVATTADIVAHGPFADAFPARPGVAIAGLACLVVLALVAIATLLERRSSGQGAP